MLHMRSAKKYYTQKYKILLSKILKSGPFQCLTFLEWEAGATPTLPHHRLRHSFLKMYLRHEKTSIKDYDDCCYHFRRLFNILIQNNKIEVK